MVGLLVTHGWWDHWRHKDQDGGTIQDTMTRMVGLLERNELLVHRRDKDQDGGTIGEK